MDCLKENHDVPQKEEEGFRRWFVNEFFDIIVWYHRRGGELIGFQLCFPTSGGECTFTWEPGSTGSHFITNSFSEAGVPLRATAAVPGHVPAVPDEILSRLSVEAGELDRCLLDLILDKVNVYNASESYQGFSPNI